MAASRRVALAGAILLTFGAGSARTDSNWAGSILHPDDPLIRLFRETFELQLRTFGEEDPDTLKARSNLGLFHLARGDCASAREHLERTLDVRQRLHGPDHTDTLQSQTELADALRDCGRFDQAAALYEEAQRRMEAVLDPGHPLIVANLLGQAQLQRKLGNDQHAAAFEARAKAHEGR